MNDTICLNNKHSTTKLLTKEYPKIINNPEDKFESVLFLPEGEGRRGEGGLRTKGYFKKSYEDKPLISIVTVVFNGEEFLEETIQSVINQTYDNVEYIIIDGGSTDGTVDIIKKYEDRIDYWVSEKDSGIYDAMNKGTQLVSNGYTYYLGADDKLLNDSLTSLVVQNMFPTNKLIVFPVAINNKKNISYPKLTFPLPIIHHQGALFNLKSLKSINLYGGKYKIHADFELMAKYIKQFGIRYVDIPLCLFKKGGTSTSGKNAFQSVKELLNIYFLNGGKILSFKWIMFIIRPLYYFLSGLIK